MGIKVGGSLNDGNTITQNSIFSNTGLGIDIAPFEQANWNDPGDADNGPNQQLNYPVLVRSRPTLVEGTACANCIIELFIADSGAGEYGEGKTLIGTGVAAVDGTFAITVSGVLVGQYVTSTATDAEGNTSEFSLNQLVAASMPWEQVFPIPGRIEAEDYRVGGQSVGYSDTTAGNSGNAYRTDDVDIAATQDSSGNYNIGWIVNGEWLSYDVNVAADGTYQALVRVATPNSGRRFHIEVDGNDATGPVTIPWTGSFQTWVNVPVSLPLTAGPHVLRFVADIGQFNLNYYEITAP
jgi:hypothetical protein